MRPEEFARAMRRKAEALEQRVLNAESQTLTETHDALVQRSSGGLSTKTLRKMGHPYASRAHQSPPDPSIINTQSGKFRMSWKSTGPRLSGGDIRSRVENTDRKAKWMYGMGRMVARRPDIVIARMMAPRRLERLQKAVRLALNA